MSKPTAQPDWELVERIVALLEKSLSPSAIVRHDVKLPVIGRPHRKPRQCDIVITYGDPPRQTITVVEVQKRNRRPDITTFHGWIEKMREVGAQQLICVSALGYPTSIIDEVRTKYGPTIRLLTLEELQEPTVPGLAFVVPYALYKKPRVFFKSVGPLKLENLPLDKHTTLQVTDVMNEKLFELRDSSERMALTDLMTIVLRQQTATIYRLGREEPASHEFQGDLGIERWELWCHIGDERYKVGRFPVIAHIENCVHELPFTHYAYQQEFIDGALAWVVSARGTVESNTVNVRLVFMPNKAGFVELVTVEQQGMEHLMLFFAPSKL